MVKEVNDIKNENINTDENISTNTKADINDPKTDKDVISKSNSDNTKANKRDNSKSDKRDISKSDKKEITKSNKKESNTPAIDKILRVLMIAIFILYVITVLYATLFGRRTRGYTDLSIWEYSARFMNLVPFKSISLYLKWIMDSNRENNYVPIVNLGVNLILLLPMGYFLPELFKKLKNFFLYTLICFLFLAFIEVIQLFTRLGSFDVDDLILNMAGAFIGFGFCVLLKKMFKRKSKTK